VFGYESTEEKSAIDETIDKNRKMRAQLLSLARHCGQFSELVFARRLRLRLNVAKLDFRKVSRYRERKVIFDANSSFVALLASLEL